MYSGKVVPYTDVTSDVCIIAPPVESFSDVTS